MSIPFTNFRPPTAPTAAISGTGLTYYYTSLALVQGLLSRSGVTLRMDDDDSSEMEATEDPVDEQAILEEEIIPQATDEVNCYLIERYAAAQIASSWIAVKACTTFAAVEVCERRGNPVPKSLMDRYERMERLLEKIQAGKMSLGIAQQREADFPLLSNVRLDARQPVRQLRVQQPISDRRPAAYRQAIDGLSNIIPEPPL